MPPILVINPRSDDVFGNAAKARVDEGVARIEDLERALQGRYPAVRVRARSLSGEADATWYVYREGTWVPTR
jgi:hypothetical protein